MTTIHLILAWTGWIWTAFFGTYLFMKLRAKSKDDPCHGFQVIMEAKQPNEQ